MFHPKQQTLGLLSLLLLGIGATAIALPQNPAAAPSPVRWRKTVLDTAFRSEGVAVADVNGDKKTDVLVGDYWYEAPTWKKHEIRPPLTGQGDGSGSYSESFACFSGDFNQDRWPDVLVIGFPGRPAYWYENPGNRESGSGVRGPGEAGEALGSAFKPGRKPLSYLAPTGPRTPDPRTPPTGSGIRWRRARAMRRRCSRTCSATAYNIW